MFRILQDDRKFEVGELCGLFLGRWAKYGYVMAISVTCFIYLLGYSTVAAASWAVNLPLDFANVRQCNNTDFFMHTLPSNVSCRLLVLSLPLCLHHRPSLHDQLKRASSRSSQHFGFFEACLCLSVLFVLIVLYPQRLHHPYLEPVHVVSPRAHYCR